MEEYHSSRSRGRSAEGSQGGVPSWLIEEHNQHDVVARTPNRSRRNPTQEEQASRSTYAGLCGSPDTRRTFYKSGGKNQRDSRHRYQHPSPHPGYQVPQPQTNPLEARRKPQHQIIGNVQRMPASEPIYMDIDPSLHQRTKFTDRDRISSLSHQQPGTPSTATTSFSTQGSPKSPHRSAVTKSTQPSSITHRNKADNNGGSSRVVHCNSPSYPYVHPYVSPTAREYRVPGGMFQNLKQPISPVTARTPSPLQSSSKSSRYDERPLPKDPQNHSGEGMLMFGDDYDLGSITTGASQQELLQKRRDVKKRRDGKYGKKKKNKERIINMPPRLLSIGSWDTSPITKLTSRDNSQHTPYKDNNGKKSAQWNIMKAFTPQDEGSTDASTFTSGEEHLQRPPDGGEEQQTQQAHNQSHSDSLSLSSFPLLSTNAKEGLSTEVAVHYTQPGNIPQLQVTVPHGGENNRILQREQQKQRLSEYQQQEVYSQSLSPHPNTRPQHWDIYERQHKDELLQLENHLRYLEEQHQQLEVEIQERERADQQEDVPSDEYEDDRPRSVRFASCIAQDIEEQYEKKSASQESPTSVAHVDGQVQDNSNSNSSASVLAPKNLFPGKPKSILRKKNGAEALDSTGRYPSATRGRSHAPALKFTDSHGREVSPIRSPARYIVTPAVYQMEPRAPEDVLSLPDNPDDKDIAVLFDSEVDDDLEMMRREFNDEEDSGLISDSFIETVAAIVLQTGIRRFLAIRRVQRLHRERRTQGSANTSSPQRESPSQTKTATEQKQAPQPQSDEQSPPRTKQVQFSNPAEEVFNERPLAAQEDFFYDLAAIQIQSVFRGWWVRDSINVDHYCTTLIQKVFRGFRARIEYDYDVYRVMVVQAVWRRNLAMRRTRYIYAMIFRLQALCRGLMARKSLHSFAAASPPMRSQSSSPKRQNESAASGKAHHVRTSYEKAKMRKEQRRAKSKSPVPLMKPSSIEEARIWHVGAIIIQTYWRSYVCSICYLQSLSDVITIQSIARRWLTLRRLGLLSHNTPNRKRQIRNQIAKKTPPPQDAMARSSTRFAQLNSFVDSEGSPNRKHDSLDDSTVPSVPFRMLSEEEQSPRPIPPKHSARAQQQQSQQGHFNDPSRFGGARTVWKKGTMPSTPTQYSGPPVYSPSNRQIDPRNHPPVRHSYPNSNSNWNNSRQAASRTPSPRAVASPQPELRRNSEAPARSKGWNADEEIDKEGTRNLLMAWKQKDKANSFTIRPRSGM